jgi:hypothetical protein
VNCQLIEEARRVGLLGYLLASALGSFTTRPHVV